MVPLPRVGRQILLKGLRWQVGSGESILCKQNKWVPKYPATLIPIPNHDSSVSWVSQLINQDIDTWNKLVLESNFSSEDVCDFLSIPLSLFRREDSLAWHFIGRAST